MLSVKVIKSEALIDEAARFFWFRLKEKLDGGRKVFLLLSGGSAIEIYQELVGWINDQDAVFAMNLTLGLADERYGLVGHSDSNEEQIKKTGFYDVVLRKGGKAISILSGFNPGGEVYRYETLFRQNIEETEEVMAIMGIGPDGHTAGILPQETQEKFEQIFPQNRLAVYYEASPDYPNPFKKRITLTPAALSKITWVMVMVKSQGKEEALRRMFTAQEPIYKTPAVILANQNGVLFTDQKLSA